MGREVRFWVDRFRRVNVGANGRRERGHISTKAVSIRLNLLNLLQAPNPPPLRVGIVLNRTSISSNCARASSLFPEAGSPRIWDRRAGVKVGVRALEDGEVWGGGGVLMGLEGEVRGGC